jgi:hypothetical protein
MALQTVRRLKGMGDATVQRGFDAVADAIQQTVDTISKAFTLSSTAVTIRVPATVSGSLAVTGGVTQGSRLMALKGWVGQNTLAANGTYDVQAYLPGSAPAFAAISFVPPWAGSIAGISAKVYGATVTAGSLTIATLNATTNATTGALAYTSFSSPFTTTFTPGAYPFAAGVSLRVQAISSGWTQAAGATGVEINLFVYM